MRTALLTGMILVVSFALAAEFEDSNTYSIANGRYIPSLMLFLLFTGIYRILLTFLEGTYPCNNYLSLYKILSLAVVRF